MFFYLIVVPFLNIYLFSKGLFLFFPQFINLNEKYFFFYILMFMNIISFGGQVQPKPQEVTLDRSKVKILSARNNI